MTDPEAALRATLSDELLSSIEQSALEASHYDRASYNLGWRGRDDSWFFKVWREKLIAAVAPLLTPRAWQPMETAPKDGTPIIAANNMLSQFLRASCMHRDNGDEPTCDHLTDPCGYCAAANQLETLERVNTELRERQQADEANMRLAQEGHREALRRQVDAEKDRDGFMVCWANAEAECNQAESSRVALRQALQALVEALGDTDESLSLEAIERDEIAPAKVAAEALLAQGDTPTGDEGP